MRNKHIDLWHNQSSTLKLYLLEGPVKRPLVLVFPGGGYDHLSHAEGEPVAIRFNALGYHAAVLKYQVKPSHYDMPVKDAIKAVTHLRQFSELYNVISDKIVICGFSAGGHLAASLSCLTDQMVDEMNCNMSRPNAVILCYPVISMVSHPHEMCLSNLFNQKDTQDLRRLYSMELQVHTKVPPTFIWHTIDDPSVSYQHSLAYFEALTRHSIKTELHLFQHGAHGLSLASEVEKNQRGLDALRVGKWVELCETWLKEIL